MAVYLSLFAGAGQQFFTNAGVPLAGGKIYTYGAGGSTPQATYTTSAGNIAHSNPIVLDAAGRVPGGGEIWLTDTLVYKFVLETSAGVTVQTLDNVSASIGSAALVASSGSSLIGFIQSGSGAVARTVQSKAREVVSPEDFGAVGDNVNNDRTAILAALTAHDTVVLTENKIYRCTSGFTVPAGKNLIGTGTIMLTAGAITLSSNVLIDGIAVEGNSNTNAENGIIINGAITNITVRNCTVKNVQYNGIQVSNGATNVLLEGNFITNTGTLAIATGGTSSYQGNGIYLAASLSTTRIVNNEISYTYGQGAIYIDSSTGVFVGNNYLHHTFWAGLRGFDSASTCANIVIDGNRFLFIGSENNTGNAVGCNGIANFNTYASNDRDVWDWIVTNNYFNNINENGIEGAGYVANNIIINTNYRGLALISPEGIYSQGPAKIINNAIYLSGPGIRIFKDGTEAVGDFGPVEVAGNSTFDPANGWGIQINAANAAGSITGLQVRNNTMWNGGLQVSAVSGASYDATSYVVGNIQYGGSGNASIVSQTLPNVSGNSFDPLYTSIASGSTISISQGARFVEVTGTTNINTISAGTSIAGRQVTLKFTGILTVNDGSNLKLAGNFTTSADDTLTLICDGTDWYEIARSVN